MIIFKNNYLNKNNNNYSNLKNYKNKMPKSYYNSN